MGVCVQLELNSHEKGAKRQFLHFIVTEFVPWDNSRIDTEEVRGFIKMVVTILHFKAWNERSIFLKN